MSYSWRPWRVGVLMVVALMAGNTPLLSLLLFVLLLMLDARRYPS